MAINKSEITAKFEEEKQRVQEQSQLIYLQNQIDELRRMLKDQNNKYAWSMEQSRRSEAQIGQLQNLIERQAQEVQATLEVYKREITTLRREVAGSLLRAEEAVKPVREMQAQIHQLQEGRRQDRDAVAPIYGRIEDIEQRAKEILSMVRDGDERYRQYQSQFDQLRIADGAAVEQLRRLEEMIQVEKQNLRRQAAEAQQLVADVQASFEDPLARLGRLEERAREIEKELVEIPPQLDSIAERLPAMVEETRRVERVATERFLMNQERLEDLRHQSDERLVDLHETSDQHLLHLTSWLERIDSWCREEEGRVARIGNRLEILHQRHDSRLSDLEDQEFETMERIASAWSAVLDVAKSRQVERRDDETKPRPDNR